MASSSWSETRQLEENLKLTIILSIGVTGIEDILNAFGNVNLLYRAFQTNNNVEKAFLHISGNIYRPGSHYVPNIL